MQARGLGSSQRAVLTALKRAGPSTVPRLAAELGRNVETLRAHLKTLTAGGLVRRDSLVQRGRGRPEIVYSLTSEADTYFPDRAGELLAGLATHLQRCGREDLLRDFFEHAIAERRTESLARVAQRSGRDRLEEVARILSELGFVAVVEDLESGAQLRLCHCPMRQLVAVTTLPCRAELGFVTELVGEPLVRTCYIPAGDASCSYRPGGADG